MSSGPGATASPWSATNTWSPAVSVSTTTITIIHGFLVSLNNDGTLDTSFAVGAPVPNLQRLDGRVSDLLLQKDGKILVSGSFSHVLDGSPSPPARTAIARFTANGDLDNTFAFVLNTWPTDTNALLIPAMGLQPNGRILVEGHFFNNSGGNSMYKFSGVARLNTNGSTGPHFYPRNPGQWVFSL